MSSRLFTLKHSTPRRSQPLIAVPMMEQLGAVKVYAWGAALSTLLFALMPVLSRLFVGSAWLWPVPTKPPCSCY